MEGFTLILEDLSIRTQNITRKLHEIEILEVIWEVSKVK